MSKRNAIIIISVVVLLIVGGLLFFYFRSANTGGGNQASTATSTNPFGTEPTITPSFGNGNTGNGQAGSAGTTGKNFGNLTELYSNPTSGSIFFENSSNQDDLEFIERANGNVYQYLPQVQNSESERLTNTTIPKVQEVVWSANTNDLVYRYLDNDTDTIDSFSGIITNATTTGNLGQINGVFLNKNIAELVSDPKGDKIFSLFEKNDGSGSYGVMSNFDGTGQKQIFSSPASSWNISWPTNSIITFTTKPTYVDYGYLFFFNTQTGSLQRIFGNMSGLATLTNSDASLVAYSESQNGAFRLGVYDVKNKIDKNITITTLADKCVWGVQNSTILYCAVPQNIPSDNYPDAWYQGTESFSDNIWMIDTKSGATTEIYQNQTGTNENPAIDAMNLTVSPDDKYLAFQNKIDLSEWLLNLQQ